ncbi:nuclear transport factor 2 family protein [Nostoc sp.]|uniref:nuclear transport factor 2 family protein n=1 Tax=Nostoc sp. TaxID=1180 RepID=UPI002FF8AE8D
MTTDDAIRDRTLKSVRSYLDLMRAQRWDEWIDLWADDAILKFPYAPEGRQGVFKGKEAILTYMSGTTGKISVDSVADLQIYPMLDPEAATVELEINGRLLLDDTPYNQRYITIFQFKGGKIQHYREYWNPLISMKAYGGYDAWMAQFAGGQSGDTA